MWSQGWMSWRPGLLSGLLSSIYSAAAAARSLQSCPTMCDPIDGSPPGFPVPGILQARTLEWFAISFSNAWKWKVKVKSLSYVRLLATPWIAAFQAPPSMGFSKQEVLEWGAIDGYILIELPLKAKLLSRVQLFVTPWTVAYQVPPSMGFSRQEYWSGLPFPSPGDLPDPGIESGSPAW